MARRNSLVINNIGGNMNRYIVRFLFKGMEQSRTFYSYGYARDYVRMISLNCAFVSDIEMIEICGKVG